MRPDLPAPPICPRRPPRRTVVHCAAIWAAAFGFASLYVAAGGSVGGELVAPALVTALQERQPGMVATLWTVGFLKLGAGAGLIAADRLARGGRRRLLAWGCVLLGVGLAVWGVAEGLSGLLVLCGAIRPLDGWGDGAVAVWYAGLWGPYWIAGGCLFLSAAAHLRRS